MKTLLVAAAFLLPFQGCAARVENSRALPIVTGGVPSATIVLAKNPTRAAQFAAFELQWHLLRMTGGTVPIVREGQPVAGTPILVGDSGLVRKLGIRPDRFGPEEYLVKFTEVAVVLAGHDKADWGAVRYDDTPDRDEIASWPSLWDERGSAHAVCDFLERDCGVRWFNPTDSGTDIPVRKTLAVRGPDIRRSPFMKYRFTGCLDNAAYDECTGLWTTASAEGKVWEGRAYAELRRQSPGNAYAPAKAARTALFRLRHKEGGEPCFGNHAFYGYYGRFWAPEKDKAAIFEGKHADWFAQGYPGQPPQLCYTNTGLIRQAAKDACEFFETGKTYPGAQAAGRFFCLEPMDNNAFCKCPECRKWFGERDAGSPYFTNGKHSEYFFQFVNEVAKIVGKKHPDKRIVCLAYMSHGAPPEKIRLEPNVLVQYCFACNRLNYDRASYNHETDLLRRWRQDYPGRDLYLWNYDCFPLERARVNRFNCFPGFFAHTAGKQFGLFRECECRGVFHCGYGQEVDGYVTYKLMDDPALSVDAILDDYFTRAYGRAAAPMKKFYETVERIYGDPQNYGEEVASGRPSPHHHQTEAVAWDNLGTAERMAELGKLVDEAAALVETPEEKQRVELFRLGVWNYMQAGRAHWVEAKAAKR